MTDQIVERLAKKPDASLKFIIQDCREAVSVMPGNPRAIEYLITANEAERLLVSRDRLRGARQRARGCMFDPLNVDIKKRRFIRNSDYDKSQQRTACFQIGWWRKSLKLSGRGSV